MTVDNIIDAEIVEVDEHPPAKAEQCPQGKNERQHLVARRIATAAASFPQARQKAASRAKDAGRRGARTAYVAGQGVKSWSDRSFATLTFGLHRQTIRAAQAAGDREALALWEEKLARAKRERQERLLLLPKQIAALFAAGAVICVAVLVALFLLALTVQLYPGGLTWSSWWGGVATVLDVVGTGFKWLAIGLLWAAIPLALWSAVREGKRAGRVPRWLTTEGERAELDSLIDERMISMALAHLGIPALNEFFKNGGQLRYIVPPRVDGDGTFARVDLPLGVSVEKIADKRPLLAGNLKRAALETWPTKDDEEGILDLWIADKGKLNASAGPWPLAAEGECDYFAGVPFGRSQRGDVITAPLFENNYLIGGRPGQGKSAALRTLLLGAALDPTAELWVCVMGESPDFKPFGPRLSRYAMGLDDEVCAAAVQWLKDALAEMERRGKLLGDLPGTPPKINRKLANRRELGLHPIVMVFDEVHELFLSDYGKEAEQRMVRLIKRGRKYGITLLAATQSPTADSIPKDVTRNMSCGVAFSVADHVANDGLLGTGKYRAGIRATELRTNVDRGTSVTVGITANAFELIRGFYVKFEDGVDDVSPIVARAMQSITELRRTGEPTAVLEAGDELDLLADVHDAMQDEPKVRTAALLHRLVEADPTGTYAEWSPQKFKAELDEVGVPVRKSDGQSVIRLEDVQRALSQADEDDD